MLERQTRRAFLTDVSKGTLLATVGPALAMELGLAPRAMAQDREVALNFGELESLVCFMQETPVAKLQPALAEKIRSGMALPRLLAAGALANARTFGGEDYIGFHTLMALSPALKMSRKLPLEQQALPVFKVLYRNTNRIQETGGRAAEILKSVPAGQDHPTAEQLHDAVRRKDAPESQRLFATMVANNAQEAFDALLPCVHDNLEVHRTVLPYRAWDLLAVVGQEHAHTLLRQSLHYCLNAEKHRRPEWDEHGSVLTRLLDEHKLLGRAPGNRPMDDTAMDQLSQLVFNGPPAEAAGAVAAALGEGFAANDVGEAISLAANQLLLRDHGRPPEWESAGKPVGSVHGDSIGVHASDSINAWRNLARVSRGRNVYACLILGAWQTAESRSGFGTYGKQMMEWEPVPTKQQLNAVSAREAEPLLRELDSAVQQNLQARASAIVHQYGRLGLPEEAVFQRLLRPAVSEDGALHAEKFYQTVWDEFHTTRPAYRWRHLTALARVTASEYGRPAPGQAEARSLFGLTS